MKGHRLMNAMHEEEMLVNFIDRYMNFKISDNDFESSIKSLSRPDATQTKSFYLECLGASINNEIVRNVLNIIICSDKDVEQNILDIKADKPQFKKCLEILHFFSKEDKSED